MAHLICPVIKLPGSTLIPWRNHTPPKKTRIAPTIFSTILMFPPDIESLWKTAASGDDSRFGAERTALYAGSQLACHGRRRDGSWRLEGGKYAGFSNFAIPLDWHSRVGDSAFSGHFYFAQLGGAKGFAEPRRYRSHGRNV